MSENQAKAKFTGGDLLAIIEALAAGAAVAAPGSQTAAASLIIITRLSDALRKLMSGEEVDIHLEGMDVAIGVRMKEWRREFESKAI